MITIRPIQLDDAADLLALSHQLDQESHFMLLESDERQTTLEEQQEQLRRIMANANQTIIVAADETAGVLAGYVGARGGIFARNRRTVQLVVGILQAYSGQGLGGRLLAAVEAWARQQGLHRLELTVMTHNERAVRLYRKMGFIIEGTTREDLFVDGRYVDQYLMGKLLPPLT
jgi:RimJ/RimL family protein N-acetyltransferase